MGDLVPFVPRQERAGSGGAGSNAGSTGAATATGAPRVQRGSVGRDPLWREVTGAVLRQERLCQQRTLAQVAARAGISVQYLSELERGRKEASSEMLAAACGSLGLSLAEFAIRCAGMVGAVGGPPSGPTLLAA